MNTQALLALLSLLTSLLQQETALLKQLVLEQKQQPPVHSVLFGSTGNPPTTFNAIQTTEITDFNTFAGPVNASSTLTVSANKFTLGNLDTYVATGTCADATTTLGLIANPFSATTTFKAFVDVTGVATSSAIDLTLATSTLGSFAPVTVADKYATSTSAFNHAPLMASTTQYMVSGVPNSGNANGFGWNAATTTGAIASQFRTLLGKNESLVLWAGDYGGQGSLVGVTGPTNTFACSYKVVFER